MVSIRVTVNVYIVRDSDTLGTRLQITLTTKSFPTHSDSNGPVRDYRIWYHFKGRDQMPIFNGS